MDDDKKLKRHKERIAKIQRQYHIGEAKQSQVIGGSYAGAKSSKSYIVPVNLRLPTVSGRKLSSMRTSGKKFSGARHEKSMFKQGGCDIDNTKIKCD